MLLDSFLIRAALAGLGVALAAGPLGCFVVWRRMAYFSDATAHASILGVALAVAVDAPVFGGALVVALLMALAVSTLADRGTASDTILGVTAHAALALGLVTASLLPNVRIDLMGYLFGDILSVTKADLALVWIGALVVAGLLTWRWSALLTATLGADLSRAAGIDPKREQLFLTIALAVVVACGIKVVGALLIGALLLIPAATARPFCRTPERMAGLAALIGMVCAALGVVGSLYVDTPVGPSIVSIAFGFFVLSRLWSPRLR
ncbi:High-affinity zinc uptake system membrane protein ZnuB [Jannaschia donghaensis]|uniref:High-affinity zinc uptake system membrane protein ZnuB n=2 Tax=Jannaschia donghaensis TaxID=420998 RepID=A0A0M6YJQ6_9RHOB|nr:High-affinity zinc uptake system membrane protein ZnuB [Jannaschia donghaensis]